MVKGKPQPITLFVGRVPLGPIFTYKSGGCTPRPLSWFLLLLRQLGSFPDSWCFVSFNPKINAPLNTNLCGIVLHINIVPQRTFDLCILAKDSWEGTKQTLWDSYPVCRHCDWYICLVGKRTRQCWGHEVFHCAAWGCETSASKWSTSKGDLVSFTPTTPGESKISITFTEKGKWANWLTCQTWGL